MADKGWIKLYRKVRENWIWENPEYFKAWVDILLMANHEDKQILFNGHVITIRKGQKLTSLSKLAERWNWSRNRVDRYLRLLSEAEMVTASRTPNGTLLTVEKYGFYQTPWDSDEATHEATVGATHGATGEATVGAQTRIIKNYKELKNEEEVCVETHTIPTLDDVIGLAIMLGQELTTEEAQRFIDYNAALGWKMEWQYALKRWLDKHVEKQKEQENRWGNDPDQRKEYGGEIDWGY